MSSEGVSGEAVLDGHEGRCVFARTSRITMSREGEPGSVRLRRYGVLIVSKRRGARARQIGEMVRASAASAANAAQVGVMHYLEDPPADGTTFLVEVERKKRQVAFEVLFEDVVGGYRAVARIPDI